MNKKEVRQKFRDSVFKRDGNKCVLCGDTESKLDAHHISNRKGMPHGGYVASNGITLCDKPGGCHMKVEEFYFSPGLNDDKENPLHPIQLYKLIGSDFIQALKDSENLGRM